MYFSNPDYSTKYSTLVRALLDVSQPNRVRRNVPHRRPVLKKLPNVLAINNIAFDEVLFDIPLVINTIFSPTLFVRVFPNVVPFDKVLLNVALLIKTLLAVLLFVKNLSTQFRSPLGRLTYKRVPRRLYIHHVLFKVIILAETLHNVFVLRDKTLLPNLGLFVKRLFSVLVFVKDHSTALFVKVLLIL